MEDKISNERLQTLIKLGIDKFSSKGSSQICKKLGDTVENSFENNRINYLETLFIFERLKLASILAHFCEEGGK